MPLEFPGLRIAIVHHWFLEPAGGERVCEDLAGLLGFPDFYTLVCDPDALTPNLKKCAVTTSFIQNLPRSFSWHRYYAPFYPLAVEQFDMTPYGLVISSDSSVVKGVITRPETCHICYCHSPMRYAWNMAREYTADMGMLKKVVFDVIMHYLRQWDHGASARVDYFVANSHNVRRRIRKYYRRDAKVIYPPCDVERFSVSDSVDDYYLLVTRLVKYKRADLAVKAFAENGKRLVVVGRGPEEESLKRIAPKNIEFVGWLSDEAIRSVYARSRALIFPGEEDLGIVPLEAQASGRPVIAYGKGGVLETVVPNKTGLFFPEQTTEALNEAVHRFEHCLDQFDPYAIHKHAEGFGRQRFVAAMRSHIAWCLEDHAATMSPDKVIL